MVAALEQVRQRSELDRFVEVVESASGCDPSLRLSMSSMIKNLGPPSSPSFMTPIPPMDTCTYPGKGLSLPQLLFALNEELSNLGHPLPYVERELFKLFKEWDADHLCSITLEEVSKLERDILTALVAVRESKNSFAHINRIPLDILCLIPTYLSSHKDRFHASFVCRHWRRAFLQRGSLWSELLLRKGEDYVKTLLERAKGSVLDVVHGYRVPLDTVMLLSPHAQQIKHLEFPQNLWSDILGFSQVNSGQLPLLRTLKIRIIMIARDDHGQPNVLTPPSPPLFGGSVNLEEFHWELCFPLDFGTEWVGSLSHFTFPNLTTFKLTATPLGGLIASDLLDFLKASPTLRTVEVRITGCIIPSGIPRDTLVLPNVETFSLRSTDDTRHVYKFAIHVSCPRAKYTSLTNGLSDDQMTYDLDAIFPGPSSWNTIIRQYSASPVEEVTFEINDQLTFTIYSLTFQSPDGTVIELGFEVSNSGQNVPGLRRVLDLDIFTRACRTIHSHPQLSYVKRLHINDSSEILGGDNEPGDMAGVVVELFRSLGPLEELIFHGCDIQIFLAPRVYLREFGSADRVFPPVRGLTILEPFVHEEQQGLDGLEELARLQHELGQPLERVTVRAGEIPTALAERLRQWVGAVECYEL